ncbi:septum formation initiator family protein [Streptomyces sp. NPDC056411]|uniref:septum formation initiator family protein n=1 Tax=Streptomyces sp. NPDC056411 TaxID=3345813 RepID=UPI0035DD21A5
MRGQGRPRGGQKRFSALFPSAAAPRTAARAPFVLLIVVLLGSGLITLLLLNSALNQGSFELSRLEKKTDELTDEQQALQQEVDGYSAPGELERRARRLGMVPGGSPAFLLPDGRVLGKPGVATSEGAPLSTAAQPSAAALLGMTVPRAPSGPPVAPVAPPAVQRPVPASSGTLGPKSTPGAAHAQGSPVPPASGPSAPSHPPAPAAPRPAAGNAAPAPRSATALSPTTSGR